MLAEYNHSETKRCWSCHKVYVPTDEFTSYMNCPPCRAKEAFNNVKEKMESPEFEEMFKTAKKDLYKGKWRKKNV